MVEFLKSDNWIRERFERVFHWAVVPNITVDVDLSRTLLPAHVLKVFQDLDQGKHLLQYLMLSHNM
jgi:hypothetical protein